MKKQLLVGLVSLVMVVMLQTGEFRSVRATPGDPNAPVDIIIAGNNALPDGDYDEPSSPNQPTRARLGYTRDGCITTWIGIRNHQEGNWVESSAYSTCANQVTWVPEFNWTNVPDSYEAWLYWWNRSNWQWADRATGWIVADVELHCEAGHCPWSSNKYTYPFLRFDTSEYKWVKQFFWWFDNDLASYGTHTEGTERLTRLLDLTNNLGGQLQVEFNRKDIQFQNNMDGWDAQRAEGLIPCLFTRYGENTNLGADYGVAHEEMDWGNCPWPGGDEEAELTIEHDTLQNAVAYVGHDPTEALIFPEPAEPGHEGVYFVEVKFRRRLNQGNQFGLTTELELKEADWDLQFDVQTLTQYIETY